MTIGAKLHVIYDPDADRPIHAVISAATTNDITVAKTVPIEPGATYVFDLGYYDHAWWAKLDQAQCCIVTRFKANTPLRVVETLPVPENTDILSDRIGFLPERQAKSRGNPMGNAVREVWVATETEGTKIGNGEIDPDWGIESEKQLADWARDACSAASRRRASCHGGAGPSRLLADASFSDLSDHGAENPDQERTSPGHVRDQSKLFRLPLRT